MQRIDIRGLSCFGSTASHFGAAIRLILSFLFALFLLGHAANGKNHAWTQLIGSAGNTTGITVATEGRSFY
jgi:hypothetical protein